MTVTVTAISRDGFQSLEFEARIEGEEFLVGKGRSEQAAINDLKWQLDLRDIANEYPKTFQVYR